MKLIIEMPEKVVTAIQNGEDYRYDIHTAIAQGVPYEERPQGEWIDKDVFGEEVYCSECGHMEKKEKFIWSDVNYCYFCGAEMEVMKNESN